MEFELIKEKVDVDVIKKRNSEYGKFIDAWLSSDCKTLKIKCKNEGEYRKVYNVFSKRRSAGNHDWTFGRCGSSYDFYVVRT